MSPAVRAPASFIAKAMYGTAFVSGGLALYFRRAEHTSASIDEEFLTAHLRKTRLHHTEGTNAYSRLRSITDREDGIPPAPEVDQLRPWTLPPGGTLARDLAEIAPQLKVGDVILFYGTGPVSWRISRLGYLFTGFSLDALRYSHVAVVVGPTPATTSTTSKTPDNPKTPLLNQIRRAASDVPPDGAFPGYNVMILEAIDNKDCNAPCILPRPGEVVHDQVQVTRLSDRAFGIHKQEKRWCYNRVAVRRLSGVDWNADRLERLEAFLADILGRPMEKNPTLALAMLDPILYQRSTPRTVSCSEIVAAMYRATGLLAECPPDGKWRGTGVVPSVSYAPYNFTSTGQRMLRRRYLQLQAPGASLLPEERVDMSVTKNGI